MADERSMAGNGRYMTGGFYETRNDLRNIRSPGNAFCLGLISFLSHHDHGHGIYPLLLTTVYILGRENGTVLNT